MMVKPIYFDVKRVSFWNILPCLLLSVTPAYSVSMSISGQLSDILASKEDIRQAIESQGISVPPSTPLSQYGSKIEQISCDMRLFTAAICATFGGVNPAVGTYAAVNPWDASSTCRYTAPNKTITGCATVISQHVSYTGSAWPASTYSITAEPGYYIQNNNASNATCTACGSSNYCMGGTAAATACSSLGTTGQNPTGGTYTSVSPFGAATDCRYTANKSITGCASVTPSVVSWSGSSWSATTYTITANPGYYRQNNGANNATCTICPKDSYCTGGTNAPVPCNSVGVGFTTAGTGATQASDCKTPLSTSTISADYPYIYTWNGQQHGLSNQYNNQTISNFGSTNYDSTFTTYNIYPTYWLQSMCSLTTGTHSNIGNPTYSSSGGQCWCRLKRRNDNINGAWAFSASYSASDCALHCAAHCAFYVFDYPDFRSGLLSSF